MEKDLNLNENNENKADLEDLLMLPDGVSVFNIDGDEITIHKNGNNIQTQVIGNPNPDINEIYKKIKKIIESK